jgi:hypothetical protein
MASTKPAKSNFVLTNSATDSLSPCLKQFIEILLNEVTTHTGVVAALNQTDLEKDKGMPAIRRQSPAPSSTQAAGSVLEKGEAWKDW